MEAACGYTEQILWVHGPPLWKGKKRCCPETVTSPSASRYYGLGVDEFMEARESAVSFIKGERAEVETDDGLTSEYENGVKSVSFTKESYYACQKVFSTMKVKRTSASSGGQRSRIYKKEL